MNEAMFNHQVKVYVQMNSKFLELDKDYTYWVVDATKSNDNDLWKFEVHLNFSISITMTPYLYVQFYTRNYTITQDKKDI